MLGDDEVVTREWRDLRMCELLPQAFGQSDVEVA